MRIRDLQRALNQVRKAKEKINKMNEKYPKMYKEELDEIGKSVIAKWYATYPDPIYYRRDGSLYFAYRITLDDKILIIDFDKKYMDEYVSREYNEWIFENSFEAGYHGGAIPGGKQISKGDEILLQPRYWRTPFPELTHWGRPALLSFSPYKRMRKLMLKKIEQINKQKQDEFERVIEPVQRAINNLL